MIKQSSFLLLILLLSNICSALPMPLASNAVEAPTKTCSLFFDSQIVLNNILLAETAKQRVQGLANRENVNTGMLFVVPQSRQLSFWMKDTKVPLTIGFIDERGILFQIEDMQPETKTAHFSKRKANRALELPTGQFQQYGLKEGARLLNIQCKLQKFN